MNINTLNVDMRDDVSSSSLACTTSTDSIASVESITKDAGKKVAETINKQNVVEKVVKQEPERTEVKPQEKSNDKESTTKKVAATVGIAAMFNKQKEQQLKKPVKEETANSSEKATEETKTKTKSPTETKKPKTKSPPEKKKKDDTVKSKKKEVSKKVLKNLKEEFDDDDIEMIDCEAEEK